MELNYYNTLIAVADDCPVASAEVPPFRGATKTVAAVQYELLAEDPYTLTQEDILFESWFRRQDFRHQPGEEEKAELRREFFAKPRACLRSSPLPKRYGWGLAFDSDGKVALCAMDSEEYRRLRQGEVPGVTIIKAMRTRRA